MRERRGVLVLALAALLLLGGGWIAAARAGRECVLAAFTTDLSNRSEAQRVNIRRALARLDGRVIVAGGSFSFNDAVGQRLLEEGYVPAPAYERGGVADVPGGGICQLSSTLYNAVLLAGMRIDERSPHLRAVRSVGPGRDATVLFGKWDLRWTNPHPFAVRLRGNAAGERLVVEIRGSRPLPDPVSVEVERVAAADGLRVQTWRRTGGRVEMVAEDRYLP